MGLMSEYIKKMKEGWSVADLESELLSLISQYNKLRKTYLLIYTVALDKPIPDISIGQEDYYMLHDLLRGKKGSDKLDVYIETPGGSGETAEEIVGLFRNHFNKVSFVVPGEAKSAGTLIVLSGDEILMSETGSLGPIDAQIKIGRSRVSAYDYKEWVEGKRDEAEKAKKLNPFDAVMVAQISPGELSGVSHALKFAEDLVIKWLTNYKFKNWKVTRTRKIPVTKEMRQQKAEEIAKKLINHAEWRSHGRSIKIDDLKQIGLEITKVDDYPELSNIIYRIKTVCRLLFNTTTTYKIFATEKEKMFKQHTVSAHQLIKAPIRGAIPQNMIPPAVIEVRQKCPKCGKIHKIYGKFIPEPKIDEDFEKKGYISFPEDNKLKCSCGYEMDLTPVKNEIEMRVNRKMIIKNKNLNKRRNEQKK